MLEIFTIGGGEYIVNVLNAVAAWTGGGGFRAMLRVTMVIGFAYVLLVVAFSLNWRAWFSWFLSSTLMYMALIVPTTSVKVTDRINPGLAPAVVANVPIGLAAIASFSSQIGDWLTQQAETVFVMPDTLEYRTNGMIYGARLYDKTRDFKFRDPRVHANLTEYDKQCLFYDFLLGQKDIGDVMNSADVLAAMGPGSPARAMTFWNADNTTSIVTCEAAYNTLAGAAGVPAATDTELSTAARSIFPDLTAAAAKNKLEADLPEVAAQFHGVGQTAAQIFQQRALTDAFLEARANLSSTDGDTFAMLRAETQAKNTYVTIAQQAMTWVPLLNIVLTVVFYAMFPVIFPLFLMPQSGVSALQGYLTGFFYLAAWGPLYAVLHMFIMGREEAAMAAAAPTGFTMATMEGIDAVNSDTATIAGFLMMSIPFLAAGLARGAMAVSSQATSMLAPAQSAAEAAAIERTTGNYAYGNQSYQNLTGNVVQRDHWNTAPSFEGGFARSSFTNPNGTQFGQTSDGTAIFDNRPGISSLGFNPSVTRSTMADISQAASELETRRTQLTHARQERVAALESMGFSESTGFRSSSGSQNSTSQGSSSSKGEGYSSNQGVTDQVGSSRDIGQGVEATRLAQDQYRSAENTTWGLGGSVGLPGGGPKGGGKGSKIGKVGGAGVGNAALSGNYSVDASDGVYFTDGASQSRSDRASVSSGSVSRQGEEASQDFRHQEEASARSGTFSQREGYSDSRSFRDRTVQEIRSIDHNLAEIEEASRSLGTTWTLREGGGAQFSQDMSQIVASRYQDYAHSAEFRALGAPSLQSVDLTPTQMRARDMIVDRIARDYVDSIMAPVRDEFISPTELRGHVDGPGNFSESDLRSSLGGHGGIGHRRDKSDPSGLADEVAEAISSGRQSIEGRRDSAEANRTSAVQGAVDLGQQVTDKQNRRWFEEKDRGD
ncbi:conjugal transfer protein TraG N-terminal domain-containing protein [Novosphingobium album (ex Hu et al. 2023)]|uniref:Conjugal transfer protein TraG N-terminal domain-containing protein n=1 Tax=Novosphingobium album (ex Hu et al. 2023) TaxID=2930093 RepID=A0ABT0B4Z3_9SPHN|nr:conjugal transfer protein TraG N-terminal domain-containing protein [Novosphingobium album (ex Hu et al. 2023)]MCJ2180109.1 conjugal transfer protein TraG N-terminal domain-containing protein [Novosphingobium album (ex Hu et al. 2023)]